MIAVTHFCVSFHLEFDVNRHIQPRHQIFQHHCTTHVTIKITQIISSMMTTL